MIFSKEEAIELVFDGPMQSRGELGFLYDLLVKVKPKRILEIGTGCGATTALLAFSGAKVVTVDRFINPKQYWEALWESNKIPHLPITSIKADSQLLNTLNIVTDIFDSYDLVVIDAAHELEEGSRDYDLYTSLAPVVAIHDIVGYEKDDLHADDYDWFPTRFWYQIKKEGKFKTDEFVDVPAGGWGVIYA